MKKQRMTLQKAAVKLPTTAVIQPGDYIHFERMMVDGVKVNGMLQNYVRVHSEHSAVGQTLEEYRRLRGVLNEANPVVKVTRLVTVPLPVRSPEKPYTGMISVDVGGFTVYEEGDGSNHEVVVNYTRNDVEDVTISIGDRVNIRLGVEDTGKLIDCLEEALEIHEGCMIEAD
jgi:hypothetical protein